MATTSPGGIYRNARGEGYHDAHGNPAELPVESVETVVDSFPATSDGTVVETVVETTDPKAKK